MKRKGILFFMAAVICMAGTVLLTGCGEEDKTTLGEAYGIDKEEFCFLELKYKACHIWFDDFGWSEVEGRKTHKYGQELLTIKLGEELPEQKMWTYSFEARLGYDYNLPDNPEDNGHFNELVLREFDDFIAIGELSDNDENEIINCKYYAINIDTIDAISRLKEMLVANRDDHVFYAIGDDIGYKVFKKEVESINTMS